MSNRGTRSPEAAAQRNARRHARDRRAVPAFGPDVGAGRVWYIGEVDRREARRLLDNGLAGWALVTGDTVTPCPAGTPGAGLVRWDAYRRRAAVGLSRILGCAPRTGGPGSLDVGGWAHRPPVSAYDGATPPPGPDDVAAARRRDHEFVRDTRGVCSLGGSPKVALGVAIWMAAWYLWCVLAAAHH